MGSIHSYRVSYFIFNILLKFYICQKEELKKSYLVILQIMLFFQIMTVNTGADGTGLKIAPNIPKIVLKI